VALYDQVVTLTDQLTLVEKARLLEHLSAGLKHDLEVEAFRRMPCMNLSSARRGFWPMIRSSVGSRAITKYASL